MSPNNALHADGPRVARRAGERGRSAPRANKKGYAITVCKVVLYFLKNRDYQTYYILLNLRPIGEVRSMSEGM